MYTDRVIIRGLYLYVELFDVSNLASSAEFQVPTRTIWPCNLSVAFPLIL